MIHLPRGFLFALCLFGALFHRYGSKEWEERWKNNSGSGETIKTTRGHGQRAGSKKRSAREESVGEEGEWKEAPIPLGSFRVYPGMDWCCLVLAFPEARCILPHPKCTLVYPHRLRCRCFL